MKNAISVGDLKKIIVEKKDEFKAVIGDGVESDNKKNNNKSYKDAEKRTGAKEVTMKHKLPKKEDGNKTTLDYTFDVDPGDDYKKRVHAQAQGYSSTLEKDNKIEKVGEFGDDFYKTAKDAQKEMEKNKKALKKSGLQAKELPDEIFDKENMYESKSVKTVKFKKTEFLTEEHMISKIPDEMKVEGNVFRMKDKNENTYIVEWKSNDKAMILGHKNDNKVNENIERMKALYGFKYSSKYSKTTGQERINESNEGFTNTLKTIRGIK